MIVMISRLLLHNLLELHRTNIIIETFFFDVPNLEELPFEYLDFYIGAIKLMTTSQVS